MSSCKRVTKSSALLHWAATLGLWTINAAAYKPTVRWIDCPKDLQPVDNHTRIDCGTIEVPLNHADQDGKKIELFLSRLKSTGSACGGNAEGLYIELGGPGAGNQLWNANFVKNSPTIDTASNKAIRSRYDHIAIDMRGTGLSTPVKCSASSFNNLTWPIIQDKSTYDDMISNAKAFGKSCKDMSPAGLLEYVGTDQVVQDVEMVRQALSHKKLNYLGFSYGSKVGYNYAARYPSNVGRMALDGVLYKDTSPMTRVTTSAAGLDSVMHDFYRWCNTTTECALNGKDMPAIFEGVLQDARSGKLKTSGGRIIHDYEVMIQVVSNIHDGTYPKSKQNFQTVAKAIQVAFDTKNGSAIEQPVPPNVTTSDAYSQFAINCADRDDRDFSYADLHNMGIVAKLIGPISNGISFDWQSIAICQAWPTNATNPPQLPDRKHMAGLPPILLVNAFYDTATYSPWGLGVRDFLPTAVSIYRNGAGHTSWLHQGKTAATMAKFLSDGVIPNDATVYDS